MKYLKKFEKYGEEKIGVIKHEIGKPPYVLCDNGEKYEFNGSDLYGEKPKVFDLCTFEIDNQGSFARKDITPYVGMIVRFRLDNFNNGYNYEIFKDDQIENTKHKKGIIQKDGVLSNGKLYNHDVRGTDDEDYPEVLIDAKEVGGRGSFSRQSIKPYIGMTVRFKVSQKDTPYDYIIKKEDNI